MSRTLLLGFSTSRLDTLLPTDTAIEILESKSHGSSEPVGSSRSLTGPQPRNNIMFYYITFHKSDISEAFDAHRRDARVLTLCFHYDTTHVQDYKLDLWKIPVPAVVSEARRSQNEVSFPIWGEGRPAGTTSSTNLLTAAVLFFPFSIASGTLTKNWKCSCGCTSTGVAGPTKCHRPALDAH